MPAIIIAEGVIEVAVVQRLVDRPVVNVFHMYRSGAGLDQNDQQDVARDLANNWQDHLLEPLTTSLEVLEFRWRGLSSTSSPSGTLAPDPNKRRTGSKVGNSLAPNTALLVHKIGARPRGKRHGRMFIAGGPEPQTFDDGTWTEPFRTGYNANLQVFLDGISDFSAGTGHYPVTLQIPPEARLPGAAGTFEATSRRITKLLLDPKVATQRRRLR